MSFLVVEKIADNTNAYFFALDKKTDVESGLCNQMRKVERSDLSTNSSRDFFVST